MSADPSPLQVDVDVADLHEAALTVTVKSGLLLGGTAPPSSTVSPRSPWDNGGLKTAAPLPSSAKSAPHRTVTPLGLGVNAWANTPQWCQEARFALAATTTAPLLGTPVALNASVSAAVVARLAKMEAESRELRQIVRTLATSPGGLDFGS